MKRIDDIVFRLTDILSRMEAYDDGKDAEIKELEYKLKDCIRDLSFIKDSSEEDD